MARNVVLLCLDTVRYDYFVQYAEELQAIADTSLSECRTASTWSVPSHASMFTGQPPSEHGYHSATPAFDQLDRDDTFLAEIDDHRLVGVSANPYTSPIFGFDRLFDEFYHVESSILYPDGLSPAKFWHQSDADDWTRYFEFLESCIEHDRTVKSIANGVASQAEKLFEELPISKPFDDGCERILSRIDSELNRSDEPTFVFANVMDAHGPLTNVRGYDRSIISGKHRNSSPEVNPLATNLDKEFEEKREEIKAYRELYAAAVEYTTRKVVDFCSSLSDDTAVVVTSDHGEQLDDVAGKRRFGHITPDLTEELLHVPLVIVNADLTLDESDPVSHLDLGELVTSIAGETEFRRERPIAAEVAGLGVAHPPEDHEDFDYWNRTSRCVYLDSATGKYVWDSLGNASYYERDGKGNYALKRSGGSEILPSEVTNVFTTDIDDVRTESQTGGVEGSVKSKLEELGYL